MRKDDTNREPDRRSRNADQRFFQAEEPGLRRPWHPESTQQCPLEPTFPGAGSHAHAETEGRDECNGDRDRRGGAHGSC
jgi:hypothetical protein